MNKNLLALSVAAASAMAFSASAAVSSNIVGYVKLTLAQGYNLVSNPLNNTNPDGNKIGQLFGTVDCAVSRWTGSGFVTSDILPGVGVVSGTDFVLAPGEAVFVFANTAGSVTLVGEALVGTQTVANTAGNNFVASKIPLSGDFVALGLEPSDGATVSTWTGTGYVTYDYLEGVGYIQTPLPTVAVGQGLVVNALTPFTWSKTFTPAP
jgi:hypothetical protein